LCLGSRGPASCPSCVLRVGPSSNFTISPAGVLLGSGFVLGVLVVQDTCQRLLAMTGRLVSFFSDRVGALVSRYEGPKAIGGRPTVKSTRQRPRLQQGRLAPGHQRVEYDSARSGRWRAAIRRFADCPRKRGFDPPAAPVDCASHHPWKCGFAFQYVGICLRKGRSRWGRYPHASKKKNRHKQISLLG